MFAALNRRDSIEPSYLPRCWLQAPGKSIAKELQVRWFLSVGRVLPGAAAFVLLSELCWVNWLVASHPFFMDDPILLGLLMFPIERWFHAAVLSVHCPTLPSFLSSVSRSMIFLFCFSKRIRNLETCSRCWRAWRRVSLSSILGWPKIVHRRRRPPTTSWFLGRLTRRVCSLSLCQDD